MTTCIALLRGTNVGGWNKLPMADLRRILFTLGASEVRSYLQSGNAVFKIASSGIEEMESKIRVAP